MWHLSVSRVPVIRSSPELRLGGSGSVLAWVSLASKTRAVFQSCVTEGRGTGFHGSRCVGAMALSLWAFGPGKAARAGGSLTAGSGRNFGRIQNSLSASS